MKQKEPQQLLDRESLKNLTPEISRDKVSSGTLILWFLVAHRVKSVPRLANSVMQDRRPQ